MHHLKCGAILHYEKYDMIICYISMTCDVSVIECINQVYGITLVVGVL